MFNIRFGNETQFKKDYQGGDNDSESHLQWTISPNYVSLRQCSAGTKFGMTVTRATDGPGNVVVKF